MAQLYRSRFVSFVAGILFLWSGSANSQDAVVCSSGADTDARISSCTRIIGSPGQSPATVAIAHRFRCAGYNMKADYDRALADCNHAIQYETNPAYAYFLRAATWAGKRDLDRALADYNRGLQLATDNQQRIRAFTGRAGVWREKGDFERALADSQTALGLLATTQMQYKDQALALAYTGRGLTWRARYESDRALSDYNQALRAYPKFSEGYTSRGLTYEAVGNTQAAIADYKMALALPTLSALGKRYHDTARARLAVLTLNTKSGQPNPAPQPGRRIALVIGNGAYANTTRLPNPPNDARAVAKELRIMGFVVSEGIDLDNRGMQQVLSAFLHDASSARLAVVFYAGHGMQIDGRNFLLPIDFSMQSLSTLAKEMIAVDTILSALDDQLRTNIVFLDACRNNPLAQMAGGLAAQSSLGAGATPGAGTLIAFATAPGKVALDGKGTNSPFTDALVRHIPTRDLEIQAMLTRVRAEVVNTTNNQQVPWSNSSLLGEVYLVR